MSDTTLLDVALKCVARGWFVFPCKPRAKEPLVRGGFHAAVSDEDTVRDWWAKWPEANVGIATGASGLTVLDIDAGIDNAEGLGAFMEARGLPETYTVRTGRRPGYGAQLYFVGAGVKSIAWGDGTASDDIRGATGYVLAAGSVHPSGEAYEAITDWVIADVPPFVLGLKAISYGGATGGTNAAVIDDGGPITQARNNAMTSILGRYRNEGHTDAEVEEYAHEVNEKRMDPPLGEAEMDRLIQNACKWAQPEPRVQVILGGKTPGASVVDTSDDADMPTESTRPRYPDEIWYGTAYGEFADLCTRDNFIPKRMFSESLRTVVGAVVGDRLSCPLTGVTPRSYTIKIAPPGSGKGTSDEYVRLLFGEERWEGLMRTEAPLLWDSSDEVVAWRSRGIGAQRISPASAPGLIKAIEQRPTKKGDTVNPLAMWKPMPRVITMSEEVRGLFANFANESTGAGLESVLCELFDRDGFTSTATKDRAPASGKLMYSLLGGITKSGWDSVFGKTESSESGFLSRVTILGTEEDRTKAGLRAPDFAALRNRFFPMVEALEKTPQRLDASGAAMREMDRWYGALRLPEGISRARLNILAWRTALHLAWLRGHTRIEDVDVEAGIKAAVFQGKMREFYAPPEGETRNARCEAAIRKVVRSHRRVTLRDLREKTNAKRYDLGMFEKSLTALTRAGEIRVEEGRARGSRVIILLKVKD